MCIGCSSRCPAGAGVQAQAAAAIAIHAAQGAAQEDRSRAQNARAGKPSRIIAKMNALNEATVIRALYEASRAGVRIDLIVRGACCLKPGSRAYPSASTCARWSAASSSTAVCTGSRTTAPRRHSARARTGWSATCLRRIETCFPILDPTLAARVHAENSSTISPTTCTRGSCCPMATTVARGREGAMPFSAQDALLAQLAR